MRKIRVLTSEQKEALVLRLEAGEAALSLAKEAGVLRKSLYEWRAWYRVEGLSGLNRKRGPKPGRRKAAEEARLPWPEAELAVAQSRIAELERLVGRQQADLDFFREALRSWDEMRPFSGAPSSSRSSKK
jgi:hypothetical protein